jgi:tetratricopeptide (TPR) repeat protein
VGDPLCRPFAGRTLTTTDLESAIDPRTELPMLFSRRRVAAAATTGYTDLPEKALLSAVRAEALLARGDRAGTRAALEQAIATAPSAIGLLLTLAQLEEADGAYDGAIAHYRRIIEVQPANVVALNNLAYLHAVRRNSPAEALPLAKRAASLAPRSASVLDTWAWTEHLLGNDAVAAKILAEAIAIDPTIAETRLHAAVIAAVAGDRAKAESELKEAIRLDPALEQRDDTRELRERINAIPPRKQH